MMIVRQGIYFCLRTSCVSHIPGVCVCVCALQEKKQMQSQIFQIYISDFAKL